MAIFLGDLVNGVAAGIIATSLIFIFGEILPQAIFPRYALVIGAKLSWLVNALIFIFYPISAPIAWVLDKILGAELPTIWSKKEIKEIIKYHEDAPENIIDQDEERIVLGALSYSDKIAYDIMIPENQVFSLELNQRFTSKLVAEIKAKGHSRIPIYENCREHVVGMLYVLRLLGNISVIGKKVKSFTQYKELFTIQGHKKLDELLNQMISQKKQMALVMGKDGRFKGIVTIEDIVEEILRIKIDKM
jgi:metal transporter CNNM